jgi:DNA-binding NtrC family response regulator
MTLEIKRIGGVPIFESMKMADLVPDRYIVIRVPLLEQKVTIIQAFDKETKTVLYDALAQGDDEVGTHTANAISACPPVFPIVTMVFSESKTYSEHREIVENAFEVQYLNWLLQRSAGNITEAARIGKTCRKHLTKLLLKHHIHPRQS